VIVLGLSLATLCAADFPFPQDSPERHGLSRAALDRWRDRLATLHTKALLVVRDDKIVYEWYAPGEDANKKQGTASLAKAIVGGNSLMLAIEDGRIKPDDLASHYIPAWRDDRQKSAITIRQLATHTSGVQDAEQDGIDHMQLPGWKGAFWKREPDPFSIAVHQAPIIFQPGTSYAYSNPGMAALAYAVTASLRGAPQTDIRALLKARLFDPLGIPESHWSIGYGQAYQVDGLDLYANWGGGAFTPRATARIGQMMLHQGEWNGKRLVHRALAQRMTTYAGMPIQPRTTNPGPASGLCWWLNFDGVWPEVPRDAFGGAGSGQELLLVVPSLDLIVVRNGAFLGSRDRFWRDAVDEVFNPLMAMARSHAPYPPSAQIRGVSFAPESTIVRKALDSDNWPITWGDDDAQYTSYGDGEGFEPLLPVKLSMGIAKVTGAPDNFQGINIRTETGERTGDGAKGAKASGMLMVDGVLYMWVRNTGNSQLAWSEDHGRTWQWGFRFTTSFATPAFLNFGRNYAGARDGFVYTYSQDGPSAYESNDALVLARVPKARIRDREAYEFFTSLDAKGRPQWTGNIGAQARCSASPDTASAPTRSTIRC
jgi:CubicO group peptidase (beta-lactamase class C family)